MRLGKHIIRRGLAGADSVFGQIINGAFRGISHDLLKFTRIAYLKPDTPIEYTTQSRAGISCITLQCNDHFDVEEIHASETATPIRSEYSRCLLDNLLANTNFPPHVPDEYIESMQEAILDSIEYYVEPDGNADKLSLTLDVNTRRFSAFGPETASFMEEAAGYLLRKTLLDKDVTIKLDGVRGISIGSERETELKVILAAGKRLRPHLEGENLPDLNSLAFSMALDMGADFRTLRDGVRYATPLLRA